MQDEQKKRIQDEFWEKLNMHVDKPLNGAGNCNTGNTARAFYENASVAAEILGIEVELIEKMAEICTILTCGQPINSNKFDKKCKEWINLFKNSSINWFWLSPTLHKVLEHGKLVIDTFPIPVAWLSEEPAEASNKTFKKFRLHHARKHNPEATLEDVFKRKIAIMHKGSKGSLFL